MLSAYPRSPTGDTSLKDAAWIDLVDPTEAERSAFEQAFALRVPTKDELAEIETTSRLRVERDALYLTAPLILANENEPWTVLPTGFVLAKNVLADGAVCTIARVRPGDCRTGRECPMRAGFGFRAAS